MGNLLCCKEPLFVADLVVAIERSGDTSFSIEPDISRPPGSSKITPLLFLPQAQLLQAQYLPNPTLLQHKRPTAAYGLGSLTNL